MPLAWRWATGASRRLQRRRSTGSSAGRLLSIGLIRAKEIEKSKEVLIAWHGTDVRRCPHRGRGWLVRRNGPGAARRFDARSNTRRGFGEHQGSHLALPRD